MPNLVEVTYKQTGKSKSTNEFGMREMQEKAYEQRDAKYLLLKAPPASGKSRALMFIALDKLSESKFNDTLLAIDEFHHVSADGDNRLGEVLRNLIEKSNCHIVAMTGSYFRGDSVPVLLPEDEAKFTKMTL